MLKQIYSLKNNQKQNSKNNIKYLPIEEFNKDFM